MTSRQKVIVGQVEKVHFPDFDDLITTARIDTGAKSSSIWASSIVENGDVLSIQLGFDKTKPKHTYRFTDYTRVRVSSSMGHIEERYKVQIPTVLAGRRVKATFTLADRSTQTYPVLIGRALLHNKFVVDVSHSKADNSVNYKEQEQL